MATLKTVVRDRLNDVFKQHQEVIINGVSDWPEYRYQIGYLRGIYDAMAIVMPLIERTEYDNDDEDEGR